MVKTMKTYHILNGDCLANQLASTSINGNYIICRECLIEGDLTAGDTTGFWEMRAKFISKTYRTSPEEYYNNTVKEFEKLKEIGDHAEVCLWFEHDLFCQANMWFMISLLAGKPSIQLYRVYPAIKNEADTWKGFGIADEQMLEESYASRVLFTPRDRELGSNLWAAYKNKDFKKLKELSKQESACFQYLEEVCQAHMDRFSDDHSLGRPQQAVKEIMETGPKDFQTVFHEFSKREGIYGFGDLQVKKLYEKQLQAQ